MSDIKSPCTELCIIDDDTGLCVGCYRTSDEIAGWSDFSNEKKKEILKEIVLRTDKYNINNS